MAEARRVGAGKFPSKVLVTKRDIVAGFRRRIETSRLVLALPLLLILSAYLMATALSSPRVIWLGWLGWIALIPLFISIRLLSPLRAMLCGGLWGLYLYWFLGGFTPGWTGTVGSFLLLTMVPAAYTCSAAWITRRFGFNPLFLGAGWVLVELALQPLGMQGGLLAATQGHGPVVSWVGGLFGSGFVAFLIAAGNAALLLVVDNFRFKLGGWRLGAGLARGESLIPVTNRSHSFLDIGPGHPRAPPGVL